MKARDPKLIKQIVTFKDLFLLCPNTSVIGFIPAMVNKSVLTNPKILRGLAGEIKRIVNFKKIDVIAGIELAGITLATSLALETDKPLVVLRSRAVRVGRSNVWGDTNFLKPGCRVLLVDDTITDGKTKKKAIKITEKRKARVTDLVVFFDFPYQKTKRFNLKKERSFLTKKKIRFHPLFTWEELVDLQYKHKMIDKDFREILLAMNKTYLFKDDHYGYVTKTVNLMKRYKMKIPDYFKEWIEKKKIKLKIRTCPSTSSGQNLVFGKEENCIQKI